MALCITSHFSKFVKREDVSNHPSHYPAHFCSIKLLQFRRITTATIIKFTATNSKWYHALVPMPNSLFKLQYSIVVNTLASKRIECITSHYYNPHCSRLSRKPIGKWKLHLVLWWTRRVQKLKNVQCKRHSRPNDHQIISRFHDDFSL